ncbi:hypothetical protein [Saccharothrix sp.]|nr:hypothetical protein [Saccharothrix sp.]
MLVHDVDVDLREAHVAGGAVLAGTTFAVSILQAFAEDRRNDGQPP